MMMLAYLILAIFAGRVQHYASLPRRSFYNGIKTVPATLSKKIQAPMVYRVLMPYLMRLFPGWAHENSYEFLRVVLLWLALLAVHYAWGFAVALIWLIYVMSAQIYDTWCYTGEAIGISLALTGNPLLAALGIFLHGTSRETVLINGFVFWLATGDIPAALLLTALALCVFYGVRLYQGKHELYCQRWMIRKNIAEIFKRPSEPFIFHAPHLSLIAIALALFGAYLTGRIGWAVPVILLANVTMGKINEYRLHIAVAPWMAAALLAMI